MGGRSVNTPSCTWPNLWLNRYIRHRRRDDNETGSVIDALPAPRNTCVAFYVSDLLENDGALIVRFIDMDYEYRCQSG
jgi:hypothetical protein